MLTRILAFVAVLLLAPSTLAHAHARALSLESASLGFFTPNRDFLKEIPDLTHCCIKEKSTEQSESSNRREEYLRARYMDPSQGRFLGMDPWIGNNNDPVSLHRFLYANANATKFLDPSGRASASEFNSAYVIAAILATASTQLLRTIIPADLDVPRVHDSPTVEDAVAISYFKANIDTSAILHATTAAVLMTPDAHHTVPVYLCGHYEQELSVLPRADHFRIHAQIGAISIAIERAEDLTIHTFKLGRRRSPEGWILGGSKPGRAVIAESIHAVYELGLWLNSGLPTIGSVFLGPNGEKQRFINGHTSWPYCRRPR